MNAAIIYLFCAIAFLVGSMGVGFRFLLRRDTHKIKCTNSQCYKFTEEELNRFQNANVRVQQTLATPKITTIATEEIINNGAYLLNKEGFRIPQLDKHT